MSMKLEQQVVSLELAKRLKELGVKQESLWYWCQPSPKGKWYNGGTEHRLCQGDGHPLNRDAYSAYTVAELGAFLANTIEEKDPDFPKDLQPYHFRDIWDADYCAKMLIYLLENNLLTP